MQRTTAKRTQRAGAQTAQQIEHAGNQVWLPFAGDLGLGEFIRLTVQQTAKDQVLSYAGNIAFRGLFALFPALIALLWLLTVLRAERFVGVLIDLAETAMPETASGPIREMLSGVPEEQASGAFTLGALLSVAVAVWALAGMTRSLMVGLNAVYGVDETRPFWRSTLVSLLLAVAVSLLLVGAIFLTVFGSALAREIADRAGLGVLFRWAWEIVIWPVLVALVLCACALVYYVAPNVKQRIRWVSPGAVIAALLWLLFTVGYSIYVNRFASYENVYGALAGIVVLMAYFYSAAIILLLGAEMNQVLSERAAERDGLSTRRREGREETRRS